MSNLNNYWKNSFIGKSIDWIFYLYNESLLLKIFKTFKLWYRSSYTNNVWSNYLNREPISEKSYFYFKLKWLGHKFDLLLDKTSNYIEKIFKGSFLNSSLNKEKQKHYKILILISSLGFILGYIYILLLTSRTMDSLNLLYTILLVILFNIFFIFNKSIIKSIKNSNVYKLYKYILD